MPPKNKHKASPPDGSSAPLAVPPAAAAVLAKLSVQPEAAVERDEGAKPVKKQKTEDAISTAKDGDDGASKKDEAKPSKTAGNTEKPAQFDMEAQAEDIDLTMDKEAESIGMCITCKKDILETSDYVKWQKPKDTGPWYHRHRDCQKMLLAMRYVTSLENTNLKN